MLRLKTWRTQLVILLVGLLYVVIVVRNLNERERRSLHLHTEARAADHVLVPMRILSADLNNGDVRAVMGFQLRGNIAIDAATPAVDLKLLLNSSRGPQEVDFPKGRRLNPVEAVFIMDGNANRYPFDKHRGSLSFMIVTPSKPLPAGTAGAGTPAVSVDALGDVRVDSSVLKQSTPVPIEVDLSASVPGVTFERRSAEGTSEVGYLGDLAIITLYMKRADNVIAFSIAVTVMMLGLGMGVLAMVMQVIEKGNESPLFAPVVLGFAHLRLAGASQSTAERSTARRPRRLRRLRLGGVNRCCVLDRCGVDLGRQVASQGNEANR